MGCSSAASSPAKLSNDQLYAIKFQQQLQNRTERPSYIPLYQFQPDLYAFIWKYIKEDRAGKLALQFEQLKIPPNAQVSEIGKFWTIAHFSCKWNAHKCLQWVLSKIFFDNHQIYIDFVNSYTVEGLTPLHIAIIEGSKECFDILIRFGGINISLPDANGVTPYNLAGKNKRTDMQLKLSMFSQFAIDFIKLSQNQFSYETLTSVYKEQLVQQSAKLIEQQNQIKKERDQMVKKRQQELIQSQKKSFQAILNQKKKMEEQLKAIKQQLEKKSKENQQQIKKQAQLQQQQTERKAQQNKRIAQQEIKKHSQLLLVEINKKQKQQAQKLKLQQEERVRIIKQQQEDVRKKTAQENKKKIDEEMKKQLLEEKKRREDLVLAQTLKVQMEMEKKRKQENQRLKKQQEQRVRKLMQEQQALRKKQTQESLKAVQQQKKKIQAQMQMDKQKMLQENKKFQQLASKQVVGDGLIQGKIPQNLKPLYDSIKGNFVDRQFPPQAKTIGQNPPQHLKNSIWLRPNQIFTNNYFVFNGIDPDDITQGSLGVCYYLSTISSLAQVPQRIKDMFTFYDMNKGFYVIRFYELGKEKYVVVDDYFPCFKSTKEPLFAKPKGNELWVMILQKAWVKQFGNYLKSQAMSPDAMMQNLTGAPGIGYFLKDKTTDESFKDLYQADKDQSIIVLTSHEGKKIEGIVACHAYSLLQVIDTQNVKLYKIRNPWGKFQWNGQWGQNSTKWTPQLKKAVNFNQNLNDGVFFMSTNQLSMAFSYVSICYLKKGYIFGGEQYKSASRQQVFYSFSIKQKGLVNLRIVQMLPRFVKDPQYKCASMIFEVLNSDKLILVSQGSNMTNWGQTDVHCSQRGFLDLQPGNYLVRIKMFWPSPQKYNIASLAAYAKQKIVFKRLDTNNGIQLWQKIITNNFKDKPVNKVGQLGYSITWMKGQAIFYVKGDPTKFLQFTFNPPNMQNIQLGLMKIYNNVLKIPGNNVGVVEKIIISQACTTGSFTMKVYTF